MKLDHTLRAPLAVVALGVLPSIWTAWILWFAPIDGLTADRTAMAARDFSALWAAGRAAAEHTLAILSDPASFTAYLRTAFGAGMPEQIWPYPPTILLLARPLAALPLGPGFVFYSALSLAAFIAALRLGGLSGWARLAVLTSPAVAANVLAGQNGCLISALLVGGLVLIDRAPIAAGLLLGGLVIKPQFALLVPICLVAGRHWRPLAVSCISAATLALSSLLIFGYKPWVEYFSQGRQAVAAYVGAPWQSDPAHSIFSSVFMATRSLGSDVSTAYVVQAAASCVCIYCAWRLWRLPHLSAMQRTAATAPLVLLAAPWVHTYDMPALAVSVVILADLVGRDAGARHILLAFAWLWPGLPPLFPIPIVLTVLSVASVAWIAAPTRQPGCVAPQPA